MTDDEWTPEDVEFLVQVASQIAIAVENSLAFRELGEIKERLATEKLYLEDEIRLDHNIGNMVGEGAGFSSRFEEAFRPWRRRMQRSHTRAKQAREKNWSPGPFTN
jgi:GAF domain-containing protein